MRGHVEPSLDEPGTTTPEEVEVVHDSGQGEGEQAQAGSPETENKDQGEETTANIQDKVADRILVVDENTYIHIEELAEKLDSYEQHLFPREKIKELQREDIHSLSIINYIEKEVLPKETRKAKKIIMMAEDFFIDSRDGLLYHLDYPAGGMVREYCIIQLYIPEELANLVIQESHSSMHLGMDRLIPLIKQKYWFPRMVSKIEKYINNCHICQLHRKIRNPYRASLKTRRVPTGPGLVWYLDHAGPMEVRGPKVKAMRVSKDREDEEETNEEQEVEGKQKPYNYVLIAVDSYSMYVELIPTRTVTAEETATRLYETVICRHSWPRAMVHDRGTAFVNKLFQEFARQTGIRNYQTAAMNPRSNGISEARVKIVSVALAKLVNERKGKWLQYIPTIQFALNVTPTRANGLTPFVLQHGRMHNDPLSLALIENRDLLHTEIEHLCGLIRNVKMWKKIVTRNREKYNERMLKQDESRVRVPDEVRCGEFCYIHVPFLNVQTKGLRRLTIPWRGPFLITEVIDNRLVRLTRISDFVEMPNLYPINRIKCTKYGIDPPKIHHVEGLSIDREPTESEEQELEKLQGQNELDGGDQPSLETLQNRQLVVTEEMTQPWDDKSCEPLEQVNEEELTESDDVRQMDPAVSTDQQENCEESEEQNSDQCSPYQLELLVRIPPRVRTTRQAPATTEPSYRPISKLTGYKDAGYGMEMYRVLCAGDKPGYDFWTSKNTIVSNVNTDTEIDNELQLFKDNWLSHVKRKQQNLLEEGNMYESVLQEGEED